MKLVLHRRAEIAIRSLPRSDRDRISERLESVTSSEDFPLDLSKLQGSEGIELYCMSATPCLRLLMSRSVTEWVVEDVVHRDRLAQLFPG